ncbi:MAG: hypothetical protein LAO77_21060 [Acidobacteriia bacterium]|nr:hypothetical protein [Terriglobia bacterium]
MTALEQLPSRIDDLTLQIVQLREEMHLAISASETSLRAEIRAGDEETRRVVLVKTDEILGQAKMLYEDMKATLALLREGWN